MSHRCIRLFWWITNEHREKRYPYIQKSQWESWEEQSLYIYKYIYLNLYISIYKYIFIHSKVSFSSSYSWLINNFTPPKYWVCTLYCVTVIFFQKLEIFRALQPPSHISRQVLYQWAVPSLTLFLFILRQSFSECWDWPCAQSVWQVWSLSSVCLRHLSHLRL